MACFQDCDLIWSSIVVTLDEFEEGIACFQDCDLNDVNGWQSATKR
jgi:hypothetical protein